MNKSMYYNLCCPNCRGDFNFFCLANGCDGEDGLLKCVCCDSIFPVIDDIPILFKDSVRNYSYEKLFFQKLRCYNISKELCFQIDHQLVKMAENNSDDVWEWEEFAFWDKQYQSQWEKLLTDDFNDAVYQERILQRAKEMSIMTQPNFFPDGFFLEAGAGTAIYTRSILSRYPNNGYIAVDMSFFALKIRRKLLAKSDAFFIMASVDNIPLKRNIISGMFLIGILHHAERKENTLQDLVQYLCPQGCIYLDEVLERPSFLKHAEIVKGKDVSLHEEWIHYESLMAILSSNGRIIYNVIFNTPFYQFALKYLKGLMTRNQRTYSIFRLFDDVFRKMLGNILPSFQAGEIAVIWRND